MKATEAKLLEFLRKSPQFVIPIYQRTYSWTEAECRQLWDDVLRCGKDDQIPVHFVGSIVYVESGLSQVSHQAPLLVIDGQQRLTTVTLLLASLAESIGEEEPFDGFTARKIRNYFLLNAEESGDRYYKLLLSQIDKSSLTAIVGQKDLPQEKSLRVTENYNLFKDWIQRNKKDLPLICKGVAKLVIVDIALTRDQDNPQLIFESMNSTGKELSQADLIRNFILMGLDPAMQTRLYEDYWRPMEEEFGQEAYGEYFDTFMRRYLTMKKGKVPKKNEVYDVFKQFSRMVEAAEEDGEEVSSLVRDIRKYAGYFCAMVLGKEKNSELKDAFDDLWQLRVETAYPFLLEVYDDYENGLVTAAEFVEIVRIVEAYVFRRLICNVPTNSMLKTFATLAKHVDQSRYLESVQAQFQLMRTYTRFPADDEFEAAIQTRDIYNFRSRSYWLRKLENRNKKEKISIKNYSIEHILPQNSNLNEDWQRDLGVDWKKIQEQWLHTIGNLTLSGYNSEYSDRSFREKRDMDRGFAQSPLTLNSGLAEVAKWDLAAIRERARSLAKIAVKTWQSKFLPDAQLETHRPKKEQKKSRTISDVQFLDQPFVLRLYEFLKKEVLGLSMDVREKLNARHITYREVGKPIFLTIKPLKKRLRIHLNLKYSEVRDPDGLCLDLTGKRHYGPGDVRVLFADESDLEKIKPFILQAFRKWE